MKEYLVEYKNDFCDFIPIVNEDRLETDKVVGYIDISFKFRLEIRIYDWKTSNMKEQKEEYKLQLKVYQYLYENIHKNKISKIGNVMLLTRTIIDYNRFIDNDRFINKLIDKFEEDEEEKIKKDDWKMNGEFCSYCFYLDLCTGD